ncbi:diguanylate cyclase [Thalassolituus sp.]|uniref:sensor domain-containing diguanylate cyclase n=1 Tax=Thalassolituus sp. TaxID=2030822 RepID=UPI002A82722E|nr:diguanylate cyclase [Thalassolituus sp.]
MKLFRCRASTVGAAFIFFTLILITSLTRADVLRLSADNSREYPISAVSYLVDPSAELTLEQLPPLAEWQAAQANPLQFGYGEQAYWIHLGLEGNRDDFSDSVIEISNPLLNHVDVYLQRDGQVLREWRLGDAMPFSQRPMLHRTFLIPLNDITSGYLDVVIRVQSETSLQMPLVVWKRQALAEHIDKDSTLTGFYFGALVLIGLYHVLIFASVRDFGFLYFGLFTLILTIVHASISGQAFQWLWPNAIYWNSVSLPVALNITNMIGAMFITRLLNIAEEYPRLGRMQAIFVGLCVVAVVASFFFPFAVVTVVTLAMSLITFIINSILVFVRLKDRYPPAKVIFFASFSLVFASSAVILSRLNIIPASTLVDNAMMVATLVEVLLFAFALSMRIAMDRDLLEQVQAESANAKDQLLDAQLAQNIRLDHLVKMRTQELENANSLLKKISTTDALTGLHNRRHLDECLDEQQRLADRKAITLSLLILDLDHFKQLNDKYGHIFGDECLRQASERIQACVKRPQDRVFRYGGEEFVVVLPDTSVSAAKYIAEKILTNFRSEAVVVQGERVALTISIGIASRDGNERGIDVAELLQEADEHLYRAKELGRDRVEFKC